jgi:all-trans-retinol 13,14-reductase
MDDLDVIVIGGGMGGLVAAGLLAAQGMRVVLFEREDRVGGYVGGFFRGGFYFDATGAFVSAVAPGNEFHRILRELGVVDDLVFLPVRTVWNIYPDFDLKIDYQDPAAHIRGVKTAFPEHAQAIDDYEALTLKLGREFVTFESAPFWKKLLLPVSFPTLFQYARRSHADIFEKLFRNDPDMALALSAMPTSLPPSALSYAFVAVLWAKVLKSGVFYPKGGMKRLIDVISEGIQRLGVTIVCSKEVSRVLIQDKKAIGVGLSDGSEVRARWIISNGNPFDMERRLLPEGYTLYGRMHRLGRSKPSLSALLFYIQLKQEDLPPDWPYFVSVHTSKDLEAMHQALEKGSMEAGLHMVITTPSLMDSSLAPSGHHSLKVLVHAPPMDLFEKNYGTPASFNRLQRLVFSEIRNRTGLDLPSCVLAMETATPATLYRRTGNEQGAMYGLDAACGQVGPLRPPNRTAIKNLICAGHYTHPAHGIVGSAMSGAFASKIVLARRG